MCLLNGFLWPNTKVLILFHGSHGECDQAHRGDQRLVLVCVGRSLLSPSSPEPIKNTVRGVRPLIVIFRGEIFPLPINHRDFFIFYFIFFIKRILAV